MRTNRLLFAIVLCLFLVALPARADRVLLCHCPPGNPDNCVTIEVNSNAVPGHLANHPGDFEGDCDGPPLPPPVDVSIPPEGGTATIDGFATVTVPAGVFDLNSLVQISITSDPGPAARFEDAAEIFHAGPRLPYELRINTGPTLPQEDLEVTFVVPDDFASTPADLEIRVFAQTFSVGDGESHDMFDLLFDRFTAASSSVTVSIPPRLFDDSETVDASYEAILILSTTATASVPNGPGGAAVAAASLQAEATSGPSTALCLSDKGQLGTLTFVSPIAGDITRTCNVDKGVVNVSCSVGDVTSQYGPTTTRKTSHDGLDVYGLTGVTEVVAMADGIVNYVRNDSCHLSSLGCWVEVKHADGTKARYGHLQLPPQILPPPANLPRVEEGVPVFAGITKLGIVGDTGMRWSAKLKKMVPSTDGNHVHVQFHAAHGALLNPYPCLADVTPETLFLTSGIWVADFLTFYESTYHSEFLDLSSAGNLYGGITDFGQRTTWNATRSGPIQDPGGIKYFVDNDATISRIEMKGNGSVSYQSEQFYHDAGVVGLSEECAFEGEYEATLELPGYPLFLIDGTEVTLYAGDSVPISCISFIYPDIFVPWSRDQQVLPYVTADLASGELISEDYGYGTLARPNPWCPNGNGQREVRMTWLKGPLKIEWLGLCDGSESRFWEWGIIHFEEKFSAIQDRGFIEKTQWWLVPPPP